jgi:hypothetical protein
VSSLSFVGLNILLNIFLSVINNFRSIKVGTNYLQAY